MSAIQIIKSNLKEEYQKELSSQAERFYLYNHFRIGEPLNEIKNLHDILMQEALSVNYCKNEK